MAHQRIHYQLHPQETQEVLEHLVQGEEDKAEVEVELAAADLAVLVAQMMEVLEFPDQISSLEHQLTAHLLEIELLAERLFVVEVVEDLQVQ